jgi:hypothetical protein
MVTGALAMLIALIIGLVVLPARSAAADATATANLRQLGTALIMYGNDHGRYLPPSIAYVGPYIGSASTLLQDPRLYAAPLALPPGTSWVSDSAEVKARFDFVYVGAGVRLAEVRHDAKFITMYDKPLPGRPRLIAFLDSHVERVPPGSTHLAQLVQESNQARALLHVPPLPVDLSSSP